MSKLSSRIRDLDGARFGRLLVIGFSHQHAKSKHAFWLCRCDCGKELVVNGCEIKRRNRVKSCGCWNADRLRTHGYEGSSTYITWENMKRRCGDPSNVGWATYGGRGITVCDRWKNSFDNFLADMGEKPPGMTIDRIDNDRGYEPGNCQWLSQAEQNRKKESTKLTAHMVVEIRRRRSLGESVRDLAKEFSVSISTIKDVAARKSWRDV